MKSFKSFLLEESHKIPWNGNPKIGWWQDQEYYMLCELRVKTTVPSAYIKGYMQRNG